MLLRLALIVLVPSMAFAQTPQVIYTLTQPIVTDNGTFTTPWGGTGFSMDQRAFLVQGLPPCSGNWTLVDEGMDTSEFPVLLQINPIPEGTTLYATTMGVIPLGLPDVTRKFVCQPA